jgi:hypothetical protein
MSGRQSGAVEWRGRSAVDSDGERIGSIDEIYVDSETGEPAWLAVETGLFGSKVSFIPVAEARDAGRDVHVPYYKQQVEDGPNAYPDGELSEEAEAGLCRYYGLDRAETGAGRAGHERGRALRRHVVNEHVQQAVPRQRRES